MIGIEEFNLLLFPYIRIDQSGDKVVGKVLDLKKELDNNNAESIVKTNGNEWKEVGGRKIVKMRLNINKKVSYENYYSELEDNEEENAPKDWFKLDYEKLYYEHTKKSKISYDQVCNQLVKSKAKEEMHKVEKMITQVLESMID